MQPSIPKFESKEALEQYLDNLKLQLLNSEFANLCKIPPESPEELGQVPYLVKKQFEPHSFLKDLNAVSLNDKQGEPTGLQDPRFFTSLQSGVDVDVNQNFLLQSNFTFSKPEKNQQAQKEEEEESRAKAKSKETKTEAQDFANSSTQTNQTSNNDQENHTGESHSGEVFSKEPIAQASSLKAQGCQTVSEQNVNDNGLIRPKLIQPIYVMYSNGQVGYVEVDLTDENSMKNLSQFLQT